MTELRILHRNDGVAAILEVLDEDGGVIVEDFLTPSLLERFAGDMAVHAAGQRVGTVSEDTMVQKFWGAQTKRFTRLAHRSAAFVEILTDPLSLEIADSVLLPNSPDYWMNTGQMMIIGPGQKAQWLHRDADNWPTMNQPGGFDVTISGLFAISEFSADVGATRVVPGSHRWDDYQRKARPEEITQAVMPAGGVLIYTGRVLHGGGANITSDAWRFGLHISYVLGWLTPEEASPLGVGWDEVEHLSPTAQRLLGWRCSPGSGDAARLWTVDYEDIPTGLGLIT